jgi:mono/diheme cytochrome c family protein
MIRDFITASLLIWLFLVGLFVWLCFYNWTDNAPIPSEAGFCGTMALENDKMENAAPEISLGKQLFRENCAACHAGDMKTHLTGPPLLPGLEAWKVYPQADLFAFIRNSQASIANEHPRAQAIWSEYRPTVMNSFENLSDKELEALFAYVTYVGK